MSENASLEIFARYAHDFSFHKEKEKFHFLKMSRKYTLGYKHAMFPKDMKRKSSELTFKYNFQLNYLLELWVHTSSKCHFVDTDISTKCCRINQNVLQTDKTLTSISQNFNMLSIQTEVSDKLLIHGLAHKSEAI